MEFSPIVSEQELQVRREVEASGPTSPHDVGGPQGPHTYKGDQVHTCTWGCKHVPTCDRSYAMPGG